MPSFPKPAVAYDFDLASEIAALRVWRKTEPGRAIPGKSRRRLLLAT